MKKSQEEKDIQLRTADILLTKIFYTSLLLVSLFVPYYLLTSDGPITNDVRPHITHQKFMMSELEWQKEKESLISLGNDSSCQYFK